MSLIVVRDLRKTYRVRPATQDGRALRRYQRRWIVERTNAWLGNFRRLVVRCEHNLMVYQAFFRVARIPGVCGVLKQSLEAVS